MSSEFWRKTVPPFLTNYQNSSGCYCSTFKFCTDVTPNDSTHITYIHSISACYWHIHVPANSCSIGHATRILPPTNKTVPVGLGTQCVSKKNTQTWSTNDYTENKVTWQIWEVEQKQRDSCWTLVENVGTILQIKKPYVSRIYIFVNQIFKLFIVAQLKRSLQGSAESYGVCLYKKTFQTCVE